MTGQVALADLIANAPSTKWIMATIDSIQASENAVTLSYHGDVIPHVAYLTSYTPTVGDVVHALSDQRNGLLVIGNELLRPPTTLPGPTAPVTVVPTGSASYFQVPPPPIWVDGQVQQGPTVSGAWFYNPASLPTSLIDVPLAAFEIELNVADGSQALALTVHDNADTTTPFLVASDVYLYEAPTGSDVWVALPLYWADRILNPDTPGLGMGLTTSDLYTAAITSGGTLRFTPL